MRNLVVSLVLITGCCVTVNHEQEVRQIDDNLTRVIVDVPVGDIEVFGDGGEGAEIVIDYVYGRILPTVETYVSGETLHIYTDCEGISRCQTDFQIYVPAGVDVDVVSGTGELNLSNLGELVLESSVGDINTDDTGSVSIEAGAGNIVSENIDGIAYIKTGTGNVDVSIESYNAVTIESGVGNINLSLPLGGYNLDLNTGVGSVDVNNVDCVSSGLSVSVDTGIGDITVIGR